MIQDPVAPTAPTTTASTGAPIDVFGTDVFAPIRNLIFSGEGVGAAGALGGIFAFLGILWTIIVFLGYFIAIVFLVLYVYASVRKTLYEELSEQALRDQETLFQQYFYGAKKNSRLDDVMNHVASDNPNDWKLAIIEADVVLDELLKEKGYAGNSLGERLKSISPNQLASLQDAWDAHKVRNRIAHDGSDFILTQRLAQETITQYQRVFDEFGIR